MLQDGRAIAAIDLGEGVCTTLIANQERVALRVVAGIFRPLCHAHQATIGILALAGRDTLRDDTRTGVAADVNHLRAGIGLLEVVGHGHRVEFAHRVIPQQHATRILPCDGRARLDLRPRQACILPTQTSLRNKVVDTTFALLVARIPVLYCRVLHLGITLDDDLDHGSMQLILVTLRSGTPLQVTHISPLVGHDERALELSRAGGIDAEVGRELHRATYPLRNVAERAIGEDRSIECCIEVVGMRHDAPQILFHQLGMLFDGLRDGAEDDALLGQRLPEGGLDRYGVHHRIDRHTRQRHLLFERNAEFVEGTFEFGVYLIHRPELLLGLGCCVVDDILKVDFGDVEMGPRRHLHRQPVTIGFQALFEHPLGLPFLRGDSADDLLAESALDKLGLDIGRKTVLILAVGQTLQYIFFVLFCHSTQNITQIYKIFPTKHSKSLANSMRSIEKKSENNEQEERDGRKRVQRLLTKKSPPNPQHT